MTRSTSMTPRGILTAPLSARRRQALAAVEAAVRDDHSAPLPRLVSTAVMVSWIAAQVAMIGYRSPLQPIIAATGLTVAWLAAWR